MEIYREKRYEINKKVYILKSKKKKNIRYKGIIDKNP